MPEPSQALLDQLLDLIDELRRETQDYLDQPGDQQAWYNRGYANGMLLALADLVPPQRLGGRMADTADQLGHQFTMPWGKAYRHGEQMGSRETREITGSAT